MPNRDDVIMMAKEAGAQIETWMTNPPKPAMYCMTPEQLMAFAQRLRQEEREQCARIADRVATRGMSFGLPVQPVAFECGSAIRLQRSAD